MIAQIQGKLAFKSPTYVVIDCGGVGYEINISLNTYQKIGDVSECKLFTHLSIKEDAHTLYGFYDESEKILFRHLISVNGIGPGTGRMILSSLSAEEIHHAIISGNIALLTSIKGVGPKSAQRMVLELQDKLRKENLVAQADGKSLFGNQSKQRNEAIAALAMLGFNKGQAEKEVDKQLKQNAVLSVEELIKTALKNL